MSKPRKWKLGEVCEHGSLGRQCLVCELTEERDDLRAKLDAAEADARRWRAVRPLMRAEGWIRTDMARECWLEMRYRPVEGEDLTVEQIVDALAQREATNG